MGGDGIRSWTVVGAVALGAVVQQVACGPTDTGLPGIEDPSVDAYLSGVGREVIAPALAEAAASADRLEDAVATWAVTPQDDPSRADAQEAWRGAMDAWQAVELMQVLPPDASGWRDDVYSWPTDNPCRVDQVTANGSYADDGFVDAALVNEVGLDALEVLLFADADNACAPQQAPNDDGAWDALGAEGVRAARAAYAEVLAAAVADAVAAVADRWSADGPLVGSLATAGTEGSDWASQQEALNALYDAMFYVQVATEDLKLGRPLGVYECTGEDCRFEAEAVISGASTAAVEANLVAFEAVFTGGGTAGLDDVLRAVGHADVADDLLAAVDDALVALDAVEGPVHEAAVDDRDDLLAVHAAVERVGAHLKGDVATVLFLRIPSEAAGDND